MLFRSIGSFFTVVGRKAGLMFSTFSNTAWVLLVLSVLLGITIAGFRSDLLARVMDRSLNLGLGLICFGVLVVLATALNDSGVQVTGVMLATLLPVLVYLGTRTDDDRASAELAPPPLDSDDRARTRRAPDSMRSPA